MSPAFPKERRIEHSGLWLIECKRNTSQISLRSNAIRHHERVLTRYSKYFQCFLIYCTMTVCKELPWQSRKGNLWFGKLTDLTLQRWLSFYPGSFLFYAATFGMATDHYYALIDTVHNTFQSGCSDKKPSQCWFWLISFCPGLILTKEVLQSGANVGMHMFRKGSFITEDNMERTQ